MESQTDAGTHRMALQFSADSAWMVTADAPWWGHIDLRDMLNLFHPFVVSQTDKSSGAMRRIIIPANWKPPLSLRFYCADNYHADPVRHKPGGIDMDSFFDHRFKQVLLDDRVIWERDVADGAEPVVEGGELSNASVFTVPLPEWVAPGKEYTLTFRVHDKVSTEIRNDRDVWFRLGGAFHQGDSSVEQPPRFHTHVWFADPVIGEAAAVASAPLGERPHVAAVAARHAERWPMPPRGEAMAWPLRLELDAPSVIPSVGYPVTCGVPFAPGDLQRDAAVRLSDTTHGKLPLQTRVTATWPDGSVRWLLLHTLLPAGFTPGGGLVLERDEDSHAPADAAAQVRTALDAATGLMSDLSIRMKVKRGDRVVPVVAVMKAREQVEAGPVRVVLIQHGTLEAEGVEVGAFLLRVHAYAGVPIVQCQFRLINTVKPGGYRGSVEDPALEIVELVLARRVPGAGSGRVAFGLEGKQPWVSSDGRSMLHQDRHDHFKISSKQGKVMSEGDRAAGWVSVAAEHGRLHTAVRRFWQQYPKTLAANAEQIEVGLFTPSEDMPVYRMRFGEAKRHDIWFAHLPVAAPASDEEALGMLADRPPRLLNDEWFCRSGAMAVLDPRWFKSQPKLSAWAHEQYGEHPSPGYPGKFGIRDFGDSPYDPKAPGVKWRNGYWAMIQGPMYWGLTGKRRWLDIACDVARHMADLDTAHIPRDHADWHAWDGLTLALAVDHSVHDGQSRWSAFQGGEQLMMDYWLTGDPDSQAAAIANARNLLREMPGIASVNIREGTRPMLTFLRAWQATGEREFLDGVRRYSDTKVLRARVLDWRRGAYLSPIYQNWLVLSPGLASMLGHAVYEHYRLTGDVEAAQLVVAIADAVYCESMLPQEENLGDFYFYVRYSRHAWYNTQMAMLFHMAFDLTGDKRFLRAGRAAFERYLLSGGDKPWYQNVDNFGWLDPEFGGWAREFRGVETEPFTPKGAVADPDPSNFAGTR